MSEVVKVIELVGTSEKSWDDAAQKALDQANKTLHHITGIEVTNMTANVKDGKFSTYRTTVKVAFVLEDR